MTTREMHYDFKQKFNKVDSNQNRNFRLEEIDWMLNEAVNVFIKAIAEPRAKNGLGFEVGQRTIDDLRTIVVDETLAENSCETVSKIDDNTYLCPIPVDYMYYLSGTVVVNKGVCTGKTMRTRVIQHDDLSEESSFNSSNFGWRECNVRFYNGGIKVFSDGEYVPTKLCLSYIKKHPYIHNAQDATGGTYTLPDNTTILTGTQPCILPESTHGQVVDLAVMIAKLSLGGADYQTSQAKFRLSE